MDSKYTRRCFERSNFDNYRIGIASTLKTTTLDLLQDEPQDKPHKKREWRGTKAPTPRVNEISALDQEKSDDLSSK